MGPRCVRGRAYEHCVTPLRGAEDCGTGSHLPRGNWNGKVFSRDNDDHYRIHGSNQHDRGKFRCAAAVRPGQNAGLFGNRAGGVYADQSPRHQRGWRIGAPLLSLYICPDEYGGLRNRSPFDKGKGQTAPH